MLRRAKPPDLGHLAFNRNLNVQECHAGITFHWYVSVLGLTRKVCVMATKDTAGFPQPDLSPFLNWGQERRDATLALQKELLASFEQSSRDWLARVQSEVALWSELATKISASRSVPEALESYTKCVSERMKMAAEDGRRLADEAQKITQKITKSLGSGGWPAASK